ncbi:hypothetical protein MASR2M15_04820 [Anaerolineales bacterium]
MTLENISAKHLNDVEHCVRELLSAIRKAKIQEHKDLVEALKQFENELGETRRQRFDAVNTEYKSY